MMNNQIVAEIATKSSNESAAENPLLRRITARFASLPISFGLTTQDGHTYLCGSGKPEFWIRLEDKRALLALASADEGKIAAAYLDGAITIEGDWMRVLDLRQYLPDFYGHSFSASGYGRGFYEDHCTQSEPRV